MSSLFLTFPVVVVVCHIDYDYKVNSCTVIGVRFLSEWCSGDIFTLS